MYMIHFLGIGYGVVNLTTKAWIPADVRNSDWQIYLAWVAAGNTAIAFDATQL